MQLSRNSWLVKWAYFLEDAPSRESLCTLFWRVVLLSPIKLASIATIIGLFITALFVIPIIGLGWWGLLVTPGTIGVIALGVFVYEKRRDRRRLAMPSSTKPSSAIVEAYRAFKDKYCPIIDLLD